MAWYPLFNCIVRRTYLEKSTACSMDNFELSGERGLLGGATSLESGPGHFEDLSMTINKLKETMIGNANMPTNVLGTIKDNKNATQMLLVAFLEDQNWVRLQLSLATPFFVQAARSLPNNPSLFGANILHIALRNDPPVEIIQCILHKFPETPYLPDTVGRYPLHIASSAGISSEIVGVIARAYPKACTKQDFDGRTPLHFACDSTRVLYEEDAKSPCQGSVDTHVITTLVSIAPSAVLIEDMDEMNAIEIAILSNAKKEIISLLQNLGELEHREKRGQPRAGGNVTVERLVTRLSLDVEDETTSWQTRSSSKRPMVEEKGMIGMVSKRLRGLVNSMRVRGSFVNTWQAKSCI